LVAGIITNSYAPIPREFFSTTVTLRWNKLPLHWKLLATLLKEWARSRISPQSCHAHRHKAETIPPHSPAGLLHPRHLTVRS
jgi:hypothetical protein